MCERCKLCGLRDILRGSGAMLGLPRRRRMTHMLYGFEEEQEERIYSRRSREDSAATAAVCLVIALVVLVIGCLAGGVR